MLSVPLIAALGAAVVATSFLSGIFGLAGGLILMGILLAFLPVPAAMVLHAVTQMASNGWRAWLWRKRIARRIAAEYALGAFAAFALWAAMRVVLDKPLALILLGLPPFITRLVPRGFAPNVAGPGHALFCGFFVQLPPVHGRRFGADP